jgi:hypothetical protein
MNKSQDRQAKINQCAQTQKKIKIKNKIKIIN